jgi:hypothetical protein
MAPYHFSLSTVSRSRGQSAVSAAAYRSGERLWCENEGLWKRPRRNPADVIHAELVGWARTRAELWSRAETSERRKNAVVAREILVALPWELSSARHRELVSGMAYWVAATYGVAIDIAIHRPRAGDGKNRNHHAHLLFTTREVAGHVFGNKTRILDTLKTGSTEVTRMRVEWEHRVNRALERLVGRLRVSSKRRSAAKPKLTMREAAMLRRLNPRATVSASLERLYSTVYARAIVHQN